MEHKTIRYFRPSGLGGVELLSCPDIGFDFPPHFHQAYCIWLNRSGGERYSQRGFTDTLQPESFSIVAPGQVHANRSLGDSGRNLMTFYVQPGQLDSVLRQMDGASSATLEFQSRFYRDPECVDLLVELFGTLQQSNSDLEMESAFLEVFSLLSRRHAVAKTQDLPVGREKARVRRIIALLQDRLAENVSLAELAECFDCTPFHLIRFFKKESGLTPYAYLLRLRLERARELICQGRPLADAALDAGFADQSHLNRHFKALYGIPPGQFRRQMLHG